MKAIDHDGEMYLNYWDFRELIEKGELSSETVKKTLLNYLDDIHREGLVVAAYTGD